MHTGIRNHLDLFVAKIETREKLTDEERDALRALPQKVVRATGRTRIVEEGERPTHCCMVLEGMVYRTKISAGGRRQIMSFHVPGDMVDLHTILFKVADHTIETARSAAIVMIRHEVVLKTAADYPALARAFWFDTLVDASVQREAQLNIGRRDARSRTAHLLCELFLRLKRVGLADDFTIDLPLTQTDLADALGMTPIHMNRVLAKLRAEGIITLDARALVIHDWQALVDIGEFDPLYLHQEGPKDLHL